jgi:hypothetical protein
VIYASPCHLDALLFSVMSSILDADMALQHSAINEMTRNEDCLEPQHEQVSEGDSDCNISDGPDDGCPSAESDSEEDSLRYDSYNCSIIY